VIPRPVNRSRRRSERSDYVDARSKTKNRFRPKLPEFYGKQSGLRLGPEFCREQKQGEARQLFEAVVAENSNLSAYALSHLAEMARAAHQNFQRENYLDRLLKTSSGSVPKTGKRRLGENIWKENDFVFGIALLRPLSGTSTASGREVLRRSVGVCRANDNANAPRYQSTGSRRKRRFRSDCSAGSGPADKKSGRNLTEYDHLNPPHLYVQSAIPGSSRALARGDRAIPFQQEQKPEALFQAGRT